jgi:TonB family protein
MRDAWKEWEGRVVNKEFRLGEYLGGSERAGVFMTQYGPESRKAAVKLIPVGTWEQATAEAELSRLQSARELSHPHLLQILQAGRTTLDDTELLFVVMEYAEEDLSQILPERPLKAAEVGEMLGPTLDALAHLHGKGFVHGHLKPANVMAVGDQLKLSSDGVSPSGERRGAPGESSDYDAPEMARGENEAASDVWSLGVLLVMALTQRLPGWDESKEELLLPEKLPAPFNDIVRHCLRLDSRARWSLAEIAACSGLGSPVASASVPKVDLRQSAVAPRATTPTRAASFERSGARAREARVGDPGSAVGPRLAVSQRKAIPAPPNLTAQRRLNAVTYVAAAVVLVIVGILVVPRLFRDRSINSQTDSTVQERSTAAAQAPGRSTPARAPSSARASARAPETRAGGPEGRANSGIAPVSDQGARGEALSETGSSVGREKPEGLSGARGKAPRRGLTAGQVAEQVVPDVPRSALDTIRGTVRVGVRISVDSSGNVTEAELDSPGPSKYFAQLALEAAQQWKFEPPKMEGRNVLSDWLLHFQFTGKGTKVIPVQSDP